MISISFPVDEGDYIDGFIGNLSENIRLRLSKSKHRRNWSRLSDAFNAAKFEESMMLLEVAIKQFEAHRVFDKMPSQISGVNFQQEGLEDSDIGVSSTPTESPVTAANHQTVYSPIEGSCRNKINSVEGELELNSSVHSPVGITYEKGIDSPSDPANETPTMFHRSTKPIPTDPQTFPEKFDSFSAIEEVEFSSMETGNQLMEKPAVICLYKLDVPKVAYHVFDKLTEPVPTVDEELDVDGLLQSREDTSIKQDAGDSENEDLKKFDKSIEPISTALISLSGNFHSISTTEEVELSSLKATIQLMEKAEESFPSKQEVVKVVCRLLDEIPKPFSMKTNSLSSGRELLFGKRSICVFDPGGTNLFYNGLTPYESNRDAHKFDKIRGISFDSYSDIKHWPNMIRLYQYKPMFPSDEQTKALPIGSEFSIRPNSQVEIWDVIMEWVMFNICVGNLQPRYRAADHIRMIIASNLFISVGIGPFGSVLNMDANTVAILGEGMLIHIGALGTIEGYVYGNYNIQISVFSTIVQFGPNAYTHVLLPDDGERAKNPLISRDKMLNSVISQEPYKEGVLFMRTQQELPAIHTFGAIQLQWRFECNCCLGLHANIWQNWQESLGEPYIVTSWENFVWDLGLCVIFMHTILGDKDVFEGKEERWETEEIMRYDNRLSRDITIAIMRRNEENEDSWGPSHSLHIFVICFVFCFSVSLRYVSVLFLFHFLEVKEILKGEVMSGT